MRKPFGYRKPKADGSEDDQLRGSRGVPENPIPGLRHAAAHVGYFAQVADPLRLLLADVGMDARLGAVAIGFIHGHAGCIVEGDGEFQA